MPSKVAYINQLKDWVGALGGISLAWNSSSSSSKDHLPPMPPP
eukprot:CAMPEP_0194599196 /NCGR_PEP_ID=MMETSP0292-20121207/27507_1 /TAXON_ID=39354 /ORGANISM="Heterosigma akashiwo, Strain CCMP2393" /LENGTH=42 /DNA_ID= /DNA_START= /DNA_END= /DNA_ORIENTATION=